MNPAPIFSNRQLHELPPNQLRFFRSARYLGDSISAPIASFNLDDQAIIRQLYRTLDELLQVLKANLAQPEAAQADLQRFGQRKDWDAVVQRVHELGRLALNDGYSETLRDIIHDLHGGAFQALVIYFQLLDTSSAESHDLQQMFFLTRDHLKMMRNAIHDINPAMYDRDRAQNLHSAKLLVEKWSDTLYQLPGASAKINVDCRFTGGVAMSCLEFAALDRVVYNLINNAVHYTADGLVHFTILPIEQAQPRNIRYVIANAITPEHQRTLTQRTTADLGALFEGGFTTDGNGLGMRIAADFVTNAYGVPNAAQAIAAGYIGARLIDAYFVCWFHWPAAPD